MLFLDRLSRCTIKRRVRPREAGRTRRRVVRSLARVHAFQRRDGRDYNRDGKSNGK
ncbi:hypothetical protein [Bradyrhizobium niftali]|jgi:hypothetical protein|uniref:hypothetical protein n=1 Tax=Bradyrhizobium niftali TaxID=2560055 RepID=UPI0014316ABD|nr:hypothetical protein [Bradyrhizobium niftali]